MPPFPVSGARAEWVVADLTPGDHDSLVDGCDAVIHLAGLVHRADVADLAVYRQQNVQLTASLIKAARAAGVAPTRFLFSSSVSVYGRKLGRQADESTPPNPDSPYGVSKVEAERVVLEAGGVVLRFPVAYGPGDRGNVAALIRAIRGGRFILPGSCEEPRSLVASANAAEGLVQALDGGAPSRIYLVTDDDDRSVRSLVETIARSRLPAMRVRRAPYSLVWGAAVAGSLLRTIGVRTPLDLQTLGSLTTRLTFSCDKAKRTFGYRPALGFDEAVKAAVEDALLEAR